MRPMGYKINHNLDSFQMKHDSNQDMFTTDGEIDSIDTEYDALFGVDCNLPVGSQIKQAALK